jgi:phage terminase large subunit-like protein
MIALHPMQYVDLALKSEKDAGVQLNPDGTVKADWFVIATAARVGELVYLLDLYRAQIPFPAQVRALEREYRFWKSWKIGIENNAYQWALGQQAWSQGLPCVPRNIPGDKVFRAQMVTPHFETGRVRIRGVKEGGIIVAHPAIKQFTNVEALDFPFGLNDDTVDAVCGVVEMCMDIELIGQQLITGKQSRFAATIVGGGRRGRDPFDVWPSPY